jgi:hypothetical protein
VDTATPTQTSTPQFPSGTFTLTVAPANYATSFIVENNTLTTIGTIEIDLYPATSTGLYYSAKTSSYTPVGSANTIMINLPVNSDLYFIYMYYGAPTPTTLMTWEPSYVSSSIYYYGQISTGSATCGENSAYNLNPTNVFYCLSSCTLP